MTPGMVEHVGNIRAAAYELRVEHVIAPRAKVSAICASCRHEGAIDPIRFGKWGRHERLAKIEGRLRCSGCGLLGFCKLRVEWLFE